jgi:hypothetical protein
LLSAAYQARHHERNGEKKVRLIGVFNVSDASTCASLLYAACAVAGALAPTCETLGRKLQEEDVVMSDESIKAQIEAALSHPEAEDGLYFNNLIVVHEEEERPIVEGDEGDVLRVLESLIDRGLVTVEGEGDQRIYHLVRR